MSLKRTLATATTEEAQEKKRGVHRNKQAGHGYERAVRDIFRNLGFVHLTTSRSESRNRDNQKIDLINKDEGKHGRFPYNIQCKNTAQILNYHEIFTDTEKMVKIKKGPDKGKKVAKIIPGMDNTPGVINVILHKLTKKTIQVSKTKDGPKNEEVFLPVGYYAIMRKQDFLLIVAERQELRKLTGEYHELIQKYKALGNKYDELLKHVQ